jgi:1,4-alpha-glucan branching enzyme
VFVTGDMNGWNNSQDPLESEGNGFWSVDIKRDRVNVGSKYQWFIRNGDQELWRNDPYARAITNSVGQSIVHDPNAFDWGGHSFGTPSFNDMVIYEMHVGTFTRNGCK